MAVAVVDVVVAKGVEASLASSAAEEDDDCNAEGAEDTRKDDDNGCSCCSRCCCCTCANDRVTGSDTALGDAAAAAAAAAALAAAAFALALAAAAAALLLFKCTLVALPELNQRQSFGIRLPLMPPPKVPAFSPDAPPPACKVGSNLASIKASQPLNKLP